MPRARASRSAASRSSGPISYRAPCAPSYAFSIGTASVTTLRSPSMRPSIAPQHSFGNLFWACWTIVSHAAFSISIMPERLAEVLVGAVGQNGDDHAALARFDELAPDRAGRNQVGAR